MSNKKIDFNAVTGLVTAAIGLTYSLMSYFGPRARMGNPMNPLYFPLALGFLMTVFGIVLFARSDKNNMIENLKELKNISGTEKKVSQMILITCICGGLYAFIFEHAGFVISTILFLLSILFMTNGKKVVTNVVVSVLFSVGIFILFNHGLGIPLPKAFGLF